METALEFCSPVLTHLAFKDCITRFVCLMQSKSLPIHMCEDTVPLISRKQIEKFLGVFFDLQLRDQGSRYKYKEKIKRRFL